MSACVPDPRVVDHRLAWPEIVYIPSPPVQFISASSETCPVNDFVGVAVSFCGVRQEWEHQFLGLPEAASQIVQSQFTEPHLRETGCRVVSTGTRAISRDGKLLTVTTTGINANGQTINDVAVFDKQ